MPRHNTDILLFIGPSGGGKTSLINELRRAFPDSFSFSVSHTTRQPRPGEQDGVDYHFVSVDAFKTLAKRKKLVEYSTLVPGSPAALKNAAAPITDRTYGTSKAALFDVLSKDKVVLMDTDVDGALNMLDFCRHHSMAELRRVVQADAHADAPGAAASFRERHSAASSSSGMSLASSPSTPSGAARHDARGPLRCQVVFVSPPDLKTLEKRLRERKTETPDSLRLRMAASAHWIEWADTHPEYIDYRLVNDDLARCSAELNDIVRRNIITPRNVMSKL